MGFRITKIKLNKVGTPAKVTIEADATTLAKAAYLFGQLSMAKAHELGAGKCYEATSAFWDTMSSVFNGFYDNGVAEAAGEDR